MWHDEWSVFPAVNELCRSEPSTLPVSSINSLHTSIKHRKKMPLRTSHRKRTRRTNAGALAHTCIPAHACIHTHLLHIIPQPGFFTGSRLVFGISAQVMFVIENILTYNSQTLWSATVHFRTAVKRSRALSELLTLEHIVEDNVSIVIFSCWSLHLNTY